MTTLSDRPRTAEDALATGRGRPLVIGHRGASGLAPQNTLPAFERAVALGVDLVELDVQRSRDGELVVLHDDVLDATTNGTGPVAAQTLGELKRLDAGSWLGDRWTGVRIPTLREVLELVAGDVLVNIEIKSAAVTDRVEGGIAEAVVALIRALGLESRVIVSSFDPRALLHFRELAPGIATASLYDERVHVGLSPLQIMDAVGSRAFSLAKEQVDAGIVEHCHRHARIVSVYTANAPTDLRTLVELEVDGIFTDRPDRLIDLLLA